MTRSSRPNQAKQNSSKELGSLTKARLDGFESATRALMFHKPLTPDQCASLEEIALDILSGHDPRQLLGIKPVRGPRANMDLIQYEYDVATYFWGLRLRKPEILAKKAAAEVARACGITELRVMKIARKRAAFVKGVFSANPNFDFLATAKALLSFNAKLCRAEGKEL